MYFFFSRFCLWSLELCAQALFSFRAQDNEAHAKGLEFLKRYDALIWFIRTLSDLG